MAARNELKSAVLGCVRDMGEAKSVEIALRLRARGVSAENVSMTLLKCKRQGLVDRVGFRRGRVRGYVYRMLKKGEDRLAYYRRNGKERIEYGIVDIDKLTENTRKKIQRVLPIFYHEPYGGTVGNYEATRHAFLLFKKPALISAFAAKNLLSIVAPETMAKIEEASKEWHDEDFREAGNILSEFQRSEESVNDALSLYNTWLILAIKRRFDQLNLESYFIYREFERANVRAEGYRTMYEMANEKAGFYKQMYEMERS